MFEKLFQRQIRKKGQSGFVVSRLNSRSKVVGSNIIQNTRWKWGQSHARIGSNTNSGSFENKKNAGGQMGHTKK